MEKLIPIFLLKTRVYEEVRQDENVEISTVYSYASYSKPAAAEGNDIYSLVTAAPPQNTVSSELHTLKHDYCWKSTSNAILCFPSKIPLDYD